MNKLYIGLADKHFDTQPGSLMITDTPNLVKGAKIFDPTKHGLNLLPMEYKEARKFAAALYDDNELMTYRNGKRAITRLVRQANGLDRLDYQRTDDDKEAKSVIYDLLQSPLLNDTLLKPPPRWLFSGSTIVARINRAEIGDDDAKVIANILTLRFKGQVIIEDFGFYARRFHASLFRENWPIAGVYTLSELEPKLRQLCLLMEKEGHGCTYDDAETLAKYAGLVPRTEGFNAFVKEAME
jgi:hypothetical protein